MYERTVVHHETLPGDSLPTEFYAFLHTHPEQLLKELLHSQQVNFDVYPMRFANAVQTTSCKLVQEALSASLLCRQLACPSIHGLSMMTTMIEFTVTSLQASG